MDLLPEWPGSYSTLGVFYYQTGQIDKAREVLDRFKGSSGGGLDVNRIEEALSKPRQHLLPPRTHVDGRPAAVAAAGVIAGGPDSLSMRSEDQREQSENVRRNRRGSDSDPGIMGRCACLALILLR